MAELRQEHDDGAVPRFTVHDRCRKAREYAGLKQDELAARIEVDRQTISNYETGAVKALKRLVLRAWALGCGVDQDWLIDGWAARDSNPEPAGSMLKAA